MKLKYRLLLEIGIPVLIADQVSKLIIARHVPLHGSVDVIEGFFSITHVRNTGAAFGLMAGHTLSFYLFSLVALVAIIFVLWYFRNLSDRDFTSAVALSLVLTGALGNLIDRLRLGEVIDFLDFYYGQWHWPAFNVADAAVSVGVGLLAAIIILSGLKSARTED